MHIFCTFAFIHLTADCYIFQPLQKISQLTMRIFSTLDPLICDRIETIETIHYLDWHQAFLKCVLPETKITARISLLFLPFPASGKREIRK